MTGFYCKHNAIVSTAREWIQLEALRAAFESDLTWWAEPYPEEVLKKLVDASLCFGLYIFPDGTIASETSDPTEGEMIGFGRLVTDYVTTAYLTDVYVVKEHQGKGLGKWLVDCMSKELDPWPYMRQAMLLCSEKSCKFYEMTMGAEEWQQTKQAADGIKFMVKKSPQKAPRY